MTVTRSRRGVQSGSVDIYDGYLLHEGKQDVRRANYGVFKHWYAALAARLNRQANVVFFGDSVTVGGFATSANNTFPRLYGSAVQRMYHPGGVGWVPAGAYLGEWSSAGGTTLVTATYGLGQYCYLQTGTAQTATITVMMDRIDVLFTGGTTTGTAEILIDGQSAGTINTNSGAFKVFKWTSAPLARGIHAVMVRPNAAGQTILTSGAHIHDGDYGTGVHVWPVGHSGFQLTDWPDGIDHWLYWAPEIMRPDLVFVEFGFNDLGIGAVTGAQFRINLITLVNRIRANCTPDPSIVLLAIWSRADGTYTEADWLPFRQAFREAAIETDVAYFDLFDLSGWLGATDASVINDLVTTNTSPVVTSNTALFRPTIDEGLAITGVGIPGGATISSIQSFEQATLSANATATATGVTAVIANRRDPNTLTTDLLHPSDRGHQWIADELARMTVGLPRQATIPQGLLSAKGDVIVALENDYADILAVGPNGQVLTADSTTLLGVKWGALEHLATFSATGSLTAGPGRNRYLFPFAATILGVTAAIGTAPVGQSIILDVHKNGTTVFTTQGNRPTIAAAANATATEAVPDVTAIAAGDYITVDRDQVGTTEAGQNLTVFVRYRRP